MADQRLLGILNRSIAREIQVSIQYMWQHVMAVGMKSPAIREIFEETAIDEMKHAEAFAERLDLLGGVPTTTPDPIKVGGTLREMIEFDLQAEVEAVELYKEAIQIAIDAKDPVTRLMYEEILEAEEEHWKTFQDLLVKEETK
jgi:bacterioferritin